MSYAFTLFSYFFLLFGQVAVILLANDLHQTPTSVSLLFNTGPLLFFLWGILYGKPRTHSLICMLIWFYFVLGVWNIELEVTRSMGIVQITGSLAMFSSSFYFLKVLRDRQRS